MANQTKSINLTPVFVVWSVVFVSLALINDNLSLLWWAAAPWLFMLGFCAFVVSVIYIQYRRGHPVTLTIPGKAPRVVRRNMR